MWHGVIERGGGVRHGVIERGGGVWHGVIERGGGVWHGVIERGVWGVAWCDRARGWGELFVQLPLSPMKRTAIAHDTEVTARNTIEAVCTQVGLLPSTQCMPWCAQHTHEQEVLTIPQSSSRDPVLS